MNDYEMDHQTVSLNGEVVAQVTCYEAAAAVVRLLSVGYPKRTRRKKFCGKRNDCENLSTPAHTCPYSEGMFEDSETLCNCCDDCQSECVSDI